MKKLFLIVSVFGSLNLFSQTAVRDATIRGVYFHTVSINCEPELLLYIELAQEAAIKIGDLELMRALNHCASHQKGERVILIENDNYIQNPLPNTQRLPYANRYWSRRTCDVKNNSASAQTNSTSSSSQSSDNNLTPNISNDRNEPTNNAFREAFDDIRTGVKENMEAYSAYDAAANSNLNYEYGGLRNQFVTNAGESSKNQEKANSLKKGKPKSNNSATQNTTSGSDSNAEPAPYPEIQKRIKKKLISDYKKKKDMFYPKNKRIRKEYLEDFFNDFYGLNKEGKDTVHIKWVSPDKHANMMADDYGYYGNKTKTVYLNQKYGQKWSDADIINVVAHEYYHAYVHKQKENLKDSINNLKSEIEDLSKKRGKLNNISFTSHQDPNIEIWIQNRNELEEKIKEARRKLSKKEEDLKEKNNKYYDIPRSCYDEFKKFVESNKANGKTCDVHYNTYFDSQEEYMARKHGKSAEAAYKEFINQIND
jgi:hypothetical protein